MLLPLYDSNPRHRIPFQYVTVAIIGVCALVFLWQFGLGRIEGARMVYRFGTIPAVLFGARELAPDLAVIPPWLTLVTSMFLHGGWMHLIGNMLFLWVLGDNVEDAMGHVRFAAFYLLCGVAAALSHAGLAPSSALPMVGASGAISGVIGAYLVLHPTARIHTLVGYFVVGLPAWVVLGIWIALQGLNALADAGSGGGTGGGVAWWAHLGGAVAGIALVPFFKRREVKLLAGLRPGTGPLSGGGPWPGKAGTRPDAPTGARGGERRAAAEGGRLPRGITIRRVPRKKPDRRRPWR